LPQGGHAVPYKFSNCVCLSAPQQEKAVAFYRDVIGLEVIARQDNSVEFAAAPYRLFVDQSDAHGLLAAGMVLELKVPNLEAAREELVAAGCEILRWEGRGKDCYVRDPFGGVFNLWEEPEAFE
jgi:catechol 2,3-dioxygenase-like lactoylglutathione lyase family enzyme